MKAVPMKTMMMAVLTMLCAYGQADAPVVIPAKKGYAIMPSSWGVVRCKDEALTYKVKGIKDSVRLPHRIRAALQVEYERVRKPRKNASPDDLVHVFGPLNLVKEKNHTLWVVPVHLESDDGHALVWVQNADGTFAQGRFELGLNGR